MTRSRRDVLMQITTLGVGASLCGAWRAASGQEVTYTYDALGRLIRADYADGSALVYTYDANGNRTQMQQSAPGVLPGGTLSATPSSITVGSSALLVWTTTDATSIVIDNGVGGVSPVAGGSVSVSPVTTTTYTATITGPGGSIQRQATVTVTPSGFNQTIQITGPGPVNLRTLANAAGYNGAQDATVVFEVGTGIAVTGAPGGVAVDTGTWPTGSNTITLTLLVKNGGAVRGGGGPGGDGGMTGSAGTSGWAGGDALYCRLPMTVTVQAGGAMQAGGGGGAGGMSAFFDFEYWAGGGGGGGGQPNGTGGTGGSGYGGGSGSNGNPGTLAAAGFGGDGGSGGGEGGANGGGFGQAGGTATGASGGAPGYAIRKNGHAVTVNNNGTITGTVG